jgi:hypothetical protein
VKDVFTGSGEDSMLWTYNAFILPEPKAQEAVAVSKEGGQALLAKGMALLVSTLVFLY